MADNKTTYLSHALLNHVLRGDVAGTAFQQPAELYLALFLDNPTDAGLGTEVLGNGYVRQIASFDVPASGQSLLKTNVAFPQSTAAWGLVQYIALMDAITGGNMLYYGPLDNAIDVDAAGRRIEFEAGAIAVQEL